MYVSLQDANALAAFLGDLLSRVHAPGVEDVGALFSVAYATTGGGAPDFITARCVLEQPRTSARRHDYGELLLDEWWLATEEAVKTIVGVLNSEPLNGFPTPKFTAPSVRRRVGEGSSITGWPEWDIEFRANRSGRADVPSGPVVRQGFRPYSSGAQAITDWVWRGPTKETSSTPHENEFVVAVPDYRSRIRTADWRSSRTVTVALEGAERDLELQALALVDGTHRELPAISDPTQSGSAIPLEPPPNTERLELFLVRKNGDLADHVLLFTAGQEFEAAAGEPSPEEQADSDLRSGEGQEVEFKPFIALGDSKEEELVRTVVAFANTDGGRLYLGLLDDGSPQGEQVLCKTSKSESAAGWKMLADRVRHLVREKVKPVPDVKVLQIRVAGEPILAVHVSASSAGRPFSTHQNDTFVRKGATNRKPDPRTELPNVGGSGFLPLPGLKF